uniref:Uncharacterized protein n=1 Tax=Chlamydomonas euryale TaxID=1486919 RepID=A0A7R9Z2J0_9CHLO
MPLSRPAQPHASTAGALIATQGHAAARVAASLQDAASAPQRRHHTHTGPRWQQQAAADTMVCTVGRRSERCRCSCHWPLAHMFIYWPSYTVQHRRCGCCSSMRRHAKQASTCAG